MVDFRKRMTPEQLAKYDAQREWHEREVERAKAMDADTLANTVEYFACQSQMPRLWVPGDPVYDAQLFHVYVPELVSRVRAGNLKPNDAARRLAHATNLLRLVADRNAKCDFRDELAANIEKFLENK